MDGEEPPRNPDDAGAGFCRYWKTFLRPITSGEFPDFSIKSKRIRASVGAGGFVDGFVSGTWTAAVTAGLFIL
jgi:hypothetical protein